MVDDQNPPEGDRDPEPEFADLSAPSVPRRSTWAPAGDSSVNNSAEMSDDDLARALEVDFERATHKGATPIVDPFAQEPTPVAPTPDAPSPVAPEPVAPHPPPFESIVPERPVPESVASTPVAPGWPVPEPTSPEPAAAEWLASDGAVSEPTTVHALDDVPLEEEYSQPPQQDQASADRNPWTEGADEPQVPPVFSPAVPPNGVTNEPPVRRSIPTSELASTLAQQAEGSDEPADIMAQLENQLRLREQDVSDFRRWQESRIAEGGPSVHADIEAARANFGDIMDAPLPAPPAASDTNVGPVFETHTFRVDEVLDSDLLNARAPMTAPVSDIPPPSDDASGSFTLPEPVLPPPPANPTPITTPTLPVPPPTSGETASDIAAPAPAPAPEAQIPLEFETKTQLDPEPGAETEQDQDLDAQLGFGTAPTEPPRIPDLVEPSSAAAANDPFDFDALIGGASSAVDDAPTVFSLHDVVEPVQEAETESGPEPLVEPAPESLVEPVSQLAGESVRDEDVADTDQVFADLMGPFPVTSEGVAVIPGPPITPYEPTPSAPAMSGETSVVEAKLTVPPAFKVEEVSAEPTPTDQRVGRASRLFWLWFAANSSVVSVAFGGAVLSLGMSLRQAIVATLIGVAVSFLPLGLGTLAGKWSGQPTMIVSRATFGHLGNILPSVLAIIVRVFWGAVLLWFLAAGTARIMVGAELTGPLTEMQVMIIGLAVGFLLALVIAFFGYGLIARVQMVFTVISAVLIVGLIVITWPAVNIPMALTVGDGPWILVVTGAVLVFSFVGLVWAVSSADLARYQRASGSGAASMLWSTFGATIPAFVLIAYGAVLAASDPNVVTGLLETPLDTIALLIPIWYPVPLIAALAFSLLSGVAISIYSGGFALQATGASMRRPAAVVIIGAGVAVLAGVIAFTVGDFSLILRDAATTLAVPIAAWAGIFGAEMMIRSRRFSPQALLQRGGVYADFHWVNLAMLVVASVIGFGLTTASVAWLGWQGYLFSVLGVPLSSDLAASDLGVFVALILGILTPIIAGIPGIRRQEASAIEQPQVVTH